MRLSVAAAVISRSVRDATIIGIPGKDIGRQVAINNVPNDLRVMEPAVPPDIDPVVIRNRILYGPEMDLVVYFEASQGEDNLMTVLC